MLRLNKSLLNIWMLVQNTFIVTEMKQISDDHVGFGSEFNVLEQFVLLRIDYLNSISL